MHSLLAGVAVTRGERVLAAMLGRICGAPLPVRTEACDALWRALLATEARAELESFALMLFSVDGVARHVPGDVGDQLWRRAKHRPCAACGRGPCSPYCQRRSN